MFAELTKMAKNYSRIKPKELTGIINICIGSDQFTCRMTQDTVNISQGGSEERLVDFVMQSETFTKILDGTWTAMTAAAREELYQKTPLDFNLGSGQKLSADIMQIIYHMGTHFFCADYPQVLQFGPGHTRHVHGGHASALAYGYGVRFAYYTITEAEQINTEEDRNPFYQLICVIGGRGTARVASREIPLAPGTAVSIPINEGHTFKADPGQRLEFFILMYGPGA